MQSNVPMWRSVRKEDYPDGTVIEGKAIIGVLYPSFEKKLITSGKKKGSYRNADITPIDDGGIKYVNPNGGTSLFGRPDVFGVQYWVCFKIPQGTIIPHSLIIKGPEYNIGFEADHYQIEPRTRMLLDHFKAELDALARNALAREYELSR